MPFADKPPACSGCPAESLGLGYVPPSGPTDSPLAMLGQGPGVDEASAREPKPFIGRSGQRLERWMGEAGISRVETRVDNVVRCFLIRRTKDGKPQRTKGGGFKDREPSIREIRECWKRHVGPSLHEMPNLRVVVPIGMPAARWLLQNPKFGVHLAGTIERISLPEVPT